VIDTRRMDQRLKSRTIALLGIGHTNAHVLRMWRMNPIPDCRLVCISDYYHATYSGMLPGVLSGQYQPHQMQVDLLRLSQSAGAQLIVGDVTRVEHNLKQVHFHQRPPLNYDLLSIGVGSQPTFQGVRLSADANVVPIKPMQTFLARLANSLAAARRSTTSDRLPLYVIGAGVGGIEITFCLHRRLQQELEGEPFEVTLVDGSDSIGPGLLEKTRQRVRSELKQLGIRVCTSRRVNEVTNKQIVFQDGAREPCDLAVWATGAEASPLLDQIDLPRDDRGFLLTHSTLQSLGNDSVFVVGDCGTLDETATPKAGVYAVRQGPVLWTNLQRAVQSRSLVKYRPQKNALRLMNLGDGRALAEYMRLALANRWMWKLKDYIDQRFLEKHRAVSGMAVSGMAASGGAASGGAGRSGPAGANSEPMRCVGCGGKVGRSILAGALRQLQTESHPDIVVGLDLPDDAAIIRTADNQVTLTTDFFAAPVDDPWLVGRLAALNAASDAFAMGAQPIAALANIQVPYGEPHSQQDELRQVLAGANHELQTLGAAIVGGHTIEGPRLTAGFTIAARQLVPATTKNRLQVGDYLLLTKPIGSGVLLAAHMQALCPAEWYETMLADLLRSNQVALKLVRDPQLTAITDVTGFGLAGHLMEMLEASQVVAELELDRVPLFEGVQHLMQTHQIESSLSGQNRQIEPLIRLTRDPRDPTYQALFDPQTCGGLLIGYRADPQRLRATLREHGFDAAAVIGQVSRSAQPDESLRLLIH